MRVLHVNEHHSMRGGVETYLFSLMPLLEAEGINCSLAFGSANGGLHDDAYHVSSIVDTSLRGREEANDEMASVIRRVGADLIHIHNVQNTGSVEACLASAPTVITAHDYRWVCPANSFFYRRTQEICQRTCGPGCFPTTLVKRCLSPRPKYAASYYYRARWMTRQFGRFAGIIAPSSRAKTRFVDAGVDPNEVVTLPYYCPLAAREEPRPIPACPTITYIGRIAPNKGYEYFVEALGKLPSHVRGILVGVSSNEDREIISALARKNDCSDQLEMRGWATPEEVVQVLDQTSVFVFPSLWPETLGIVGLEAMSRGVPVVASAVGGVLEWLNHGKNGFLANPKDADTIADSVSSLIDDHASLIEFGKTAIRTIEDKFGSDLHINRLIRLYERAAARQPVRIEASA